MAEKTIEQIQQELLLTGQLEEADRKRLALYIQQNEEHKKSLDFLEEQIKNLEQQQKIVDAISDEKGRVVEKEEIDLQLQKTRGELLKKTLIEQAKGRDLSKEELELLILIEEKLSDIDERTKDIARAKGQGKVLANLLGIDEANQNSLTYQMFVNPKQVLDGFNTEIEKAGGIVKAFAISVAMKMQEAAVAIFALSKQQMTLADQSVASFYAATGANETYLESIYNVGRGNTALGIGFTESARALSDLYTNLNTFSTLTKLTQEELAVTTAKLEKLGISGAETSKSIQSLTVTMGITELQAAKIVERFAAMGSAIGVTSNQMIYDFMSVKESLAVFGSAMDKTFTDLAAQAKATGVAVSELLTLANKFDTFEGAATQVGKLNAILGGPYLSAMAMIENTDPTSRIEMLRQAVSNANMSFESMTYYQKKAIAEAGGFKSVDEAQRILSMSAGEAAAELENQAKSQEELNKAIERAQPIQQKLTMIMANFAIVIEPLVTRVSELLSYMLKLIDENPKLRYVFAGLILAFGTMIALIPIIIIGLNLISSALTFLSASSKIAGASGNLGASGIRSMGTAIVSVGKLATDPRIALGLFAIAVSALAIGYGFKMAAEGFASLIKEAVKAPEVFLTLGVAILALAAAITMLSLNPFVLVGMGVLLASFYGIADALNSIDTEKVINFKTVMEKSVEISAPDNVKGFEAFAEKFELVGKATNELNASNAQTFLNMINATQSLTQTLAVNQNITVKIGDKEINAIIDERIQFDKRKNNIGRGAGS